MTTNPVPLYKREGYSEAFNSCWKLIDTIRGEGRFKMYAEIRVYKRKNKYSYGCGFRCGPPGYLGFGTGCSGNIEAYPSAKEAVAAAVECMRAVLVGNEDEYGAEVMALLPAMDTQLSLF